LAFLGILEQISSGKKNSIVQFDTLVLAITFEVFSSMAHAFGQPSNAKAWHVGGLLS